MKTLSATATAGAVAVSLIPKLTSGNSPTDYSLYFHIPFCTRKCPYCHFYVIPDDDAGKHALATALQKEIAHWAPATAGRTLRSVYFGGGTPSLFGPENVAAVLKASGGAPDEVTLEANPDDVTEPLVRAYAEAGVDRVSLGVQSFDDTLLTHLGRQHSAQKAVQAVKAIAAAGISNITIDLMYDIPHQTLQQWQDTLATACSLPITHLSLYNLTIEPHTAFYKRRRALAQTLPDPDLSATMYQAAVETLAAAGLEQYEISAFAKKGSRAVHNTGYWTGRPFLGFGPSAYSYWDGWRFRNTPNLRKYCQAVELGVSAVDDRERLEGEARQRELLVVGIRLREGIDLKSLGELSTEIMRDLRRVEEDGLVTIEADQAQLTARGILFYDTVASTLV